MITCKYKEFKDTEISPGGVMIIMPFKCNHKDSGYDMSSDIMSGDKTISPCNSCTYKE